MLSKITSRLHFSGLKSKKKITLILPLIIAVIIVVVVLTLPKKHTTTISKKSTVYIPPNLTVDQQAQYLAGKGEYEDAVQVLKNDANKTSSAGQKVDDYYLLTQLAIQFKNKSDANKFSSEALLINPSSSDADATAATYYQFIGNKAQAIAYWQKAISNVSKSLPQYNLVVLQYNTNITNLESK